MKLQTLERKVFDKYIPAEIMTEVLVKLPVKSLLRFRCVSKTWRNIIDHHDFIAMHFNHTKNKNNDKNYCHISLLQWEEGGEELSFKLHRSDTFRTSCDAPQLMINFVEPYRPCASVDGLILLYLEGPRECVLELWNPSIRKSVVLPPCPWAIDFTHAFAVGFCPSSNEYKVFVFDFYCVVDLYGPSFGVYGLSDGSWRRSTEGMDVFDWWNYRFSYDCVSAKGAAHWLIGYEDDEENEENYSHVVSFDFDAEEFSFLELPYNWGETLSLLFLLDESVAVLGISFGSVCIWVMDKGEGRDPWYKWYSGESSGDTYMLFFERYRSMKVCFLENSGVFLVSLYDILMWYNIRNEEIHHVEKSNSLTDFYMYDESLFLWRLRGVQPQTLTSFREGGEQ